MPTYDIADDAEVFTEIDRLTTAYRKEKERSDAEADRIGRALRVMEHMIPEQFHSFGSRAVSVTATVSGNDLKVRFEASPETMPGIPEFTATVALYDRQGTVLARVHHTNGEDLSTRDLTGITGSLKRAYADFLKSRT